MADATLRVKISAIGERQLRKVRNGLLQIGAAASTTQAKLNAFSKGYASDLNKRLNDIQKNWKRHFDALDGMVKMFGKASLRGLSLLIKATVADFALMGAAMIGVHALFKAGNLLGRAYHAMLNVVAGAAAGAAIAISAVAAAMREQTAAMYAYKGSGSGFGEFGSNLNQVRVVMRGLHSDTALASVGIKNLNAAYAAVSKNSTFTRGSQNLLKGLMDFASAGQPLEQGVKAAGEFIGILQDPKKGFAEITKAAEALGPEMKKALEEAKKQGIDTAAELREAILSGNLSVLGGVEGQFDAVNGTVMSVLKGGFTRFQNMFADFGQQFLAPIKDALDIVFDTFEDSFRRVQHELIKFGNGPFIDSVTGFSQTLGDVFVALIRDYLPRATGMMQRMGERWDKFTEGWNNIKETLEPLIEGARVLERMLGNMFAPVIERIRTGFGDLNEMIQANSGNLEEFGTKVGGIIEKFQSILNTSRDLFFKALPFINKLLEGVKQVAGFIETIFSTMAKMFGGMGDGFGAFGLLMGAGLMMRGMKNTKGGFIPGNVGSMNVSAGVVNVTGGTAGGQMYGAGAPKGGQLKPGGALPPPVAGTAAQRASLRNAYRQGGFSGLRSAQQYNRGLMMPGGFYSSGGGGFSSGAGGASMLQRFSGRYGPRAARAGLLGPRSAAIGRMAGKFQNSPTAGIATMLALGLGSQFMPEETQGAMALGAAVAGVNPLAGIGVAGLGTALTSQNSAVGIGGGAIGGAAIGTMIAPGIGTAIGAAAGAVIGGVKSWWNKNQSKKEEAREVGRNLIAQTQEGLFEGIQGRTVSDVAKFVGNLRENLNLGALADLRNIATEGAKGRQDDRFGKLAIGGAMLAGALTPLGPLAGLGMIRSNRNDDAEVQRAAVMEIYNRRREFGLSISQEQLAAALEKPKEFLQETGKLAGQTYEAGNILADTFQQRMPQLQSALQMTDEQVLQLAHDTGTNLFDAFATTDSMVQQLTQNMISNMAQLQNAMQDNAVNQFNMLDALIARDEAPLVMDEAARNLREMFLSGEDISAGDVGKELTTIYDGLVSFFEGDTLKAGQEFTRLFSSGGAAFGAGSPLAGMEQDFLALPAIAEFLQSVTGGSMSGSAQVQEMLVGVLAKAGFGIREGTNLAGKFEGMDPMTLRTLANALGAGPSQFMDMNATEVREFLSQSGIDLIVDKTKDVSANLEGVTDEVIAELNRLAGALATTVTAIDPNAPTIDVSNTPTSQYRTSSRVPGRGASDTSSSRWQRTLGAHGQLSSMVSGKQIMTSGWRNYNLGSPSSDHINGRAYDLSGQNLGLYKAAVDASGGFAEFHGSAGGRHLHVVPNTGKSGDSSSPAMTGGRSSGSINYQYTINVNGAAADPKMIADTVMARIKEREQSDRERR